MYTSIIRPPIVNSGTTTHAITEKSLTRILADYSKERFSPGMPSTPSNMAEKLYEHAKLAHLEINFLNSEREKISSIAEQCPEDAGAFVTWFEKLKQDGPGQYDPLFKWLAEDASFEEIRWFIRQEVIGEAGFDDLISLTQLRMPTGPKLEMARNLWDEMGAGKEKGMHGPMLGLLADELNIYELDDTVWEAQALGNLMVGLAANRCFAYQSIGCLGAVELTAPSRCIEIVKGLERLGVSNEAAVYYKLHALIDIRHSQDWNRDVIYSLVAEDPARAPHIAEGALMRLNAGARTFDRYREHFGLDLAKAHIA